MAMATRRLGRTGLEVGVIGLGTEHLPADVATMDEVIGAAADGGANYIDLFSDPTFSSFADYIEAIEPAMQRYRRRLVLGLHWGGIFAEPIDNCQRAFDQALARLAGGYAEIAIISMVDTMALWQGWAQAGIERLRRYQRDGRVGFIGMSNHSVAVAQAAVESGLIDVLMFPINIYEHHGHPERAALLETCAARGVGVVAMKPYHGGRLLRSEGRPTGITPVQCLHYILSQPVSTIVPGARNAAEMREALRYAQATGAEKQVASLPGELTERLRGQCVSCRHCLPCPQEINIPLLITNLEYVEYYSGSRFSVEFNRDIYSRLTAKGSDCTECEICLERCSFGVDIIGKMKRAVEVFENRA